MSAGSEVVEPVRVGWLLHGGQGRLDHGNLIMQQVLLRIIPIVAGQFSHREACA